MYICRFTCECINLHMHICICKDKSQTYINTHEMECKTSLFGCVTSLPPASALHLSNVHECVQDAQMYLLILLC